MTDDRQAVDPDTALIGALRGLGQRIDPEPPELAARAISAFTWRTIDAELAALTYDSLLDEDRLVGVRGDDGPRQLTFEGPDLTVELEVGDDGCLVGQLVPASQAEVEVRWPGSSTTVQADDLGRFAMPGGRTGPVSLRCRLQGSSTAGIVTSWVVI